MAEIRPQDRVKKIKSIKRRAKLTYEALAEMTGIKRSTLWNYLNHKWQIRKAEHAIAIDRIIRQFNEPKLGDKIDE